MTSSKAVVSSMPASLQLLTRQRSHLLLVLANPEPGAQSACLHWYRQTYPRDVLEFEAILSTRVYEQHEIDITQGKHARLPFRFLVVHELSLDGAPEAESLIDRITALHALQSSVQAPATWLFYVLGEKVGRAPERSPSLVTVAFANSKPGHEREFREWYVTRHIRHALNIPALVSGQCFERTEFQRPGALEAQFSMIALYEQEGTPQEMLASFASIQLDKFEFPTLDTSRFAEWVYRPI